MYFLKNKCEIFKTNMKNRADSILLKKCELCKKRRNFQNKYESLWKKCNLKQHMNHFEKSRRSKHLMIQKRSN